MEKRMPEILARIEGYKKKEEITMRIGIDTNTIFAILGRTDSKYAATFFSQNHEFFGSTFLIVALFKHKERILKKSKITDAERYHQLHLILDTLQIIPSTEITTANYYKAFKVCRNAGTKDIDYIALALEKNALLSTKDKPIIAALKQSGIIELFTPQTF
ncbi:MAG: PIN domain-containing protein [Chitinophagaceae bacterium]